MCMDAQHRGVLPNVLAWGIFISPMMYFYFNKYYIVLLIYPVCIIGMLVFSISNIKWRSEFKGDNWHNFYAKVEQYKRRINKKFIN